MEYLRQNAGHIAAWLPLLALGVAVVAVVAFVRSRHRRRSTALSFSLAVGAVVGLIVMFGPMAPLFSSARRLESWRGEPAPAVAFREVATGAQRSLDSLRGRVILVNIWATWCPPCRQEMPALNRLQKAYAGRGLVVVTLTDEAPERVRRFLERHAPDTINGATSFEWLPVRNFRPFTLIVDRRGVVRDYFFGSQEYATFEKTIRPYL